MIYPWLPGWDRLWFWIKVVYWGGLAIWNGRSFQKFWQARQRARASRKRMLETMARIEAAAAAEDLEWVKTWHAWLIAAADRGVPPPPVREWMRRHAPEKVN